MGSGASALLCETLSNEYEKVDERRAVVWREDLATEWPGARRYYLHSKAALRLLIQTEAQKLNGYNFHVTVPVAYNEATNQTAFQNL